MSENDNVTDNIPVYRILYIDISVGDYIQNGTREPFFGQLQSVCFLEYYSVSDSDI